MRRKCKVKEREEKCIQYTHTFIFDRFFQAEYAVICLGIANNELTILVLLDIKSAYPSVSHDLLLEVLKSIGMQQTSLNWFMAFMKNKRQFVEIDSKRSNTQDIKCGLLQGDNLSQTLFSLVINDVTNHIEFCKFHLYADDLAIYLRTKTNNLIDSIDRVNTDIENIHQWMIYHGMELNPGKTQAILMGSKTTLNEINLQNVPKITVNGSIINYQLSVKYLGYSFNETFDSSNHVGEIVKKVNYSLSKISHCKRFIPQNAKLQIFDYGSIIYRGHSLNGTGSDEQRIQIAHNNCIRYLTGVSRFKRITPILNEMSMLNMFNRRQCLILCFMHKLMNYGSAPYLNDIFAKNENNTRAGWSKSSLIVSKVARTRDEFFLSHCLCKLWNSRE